MGTKRKFIRNKKGQFVDVIVKRDMKELAKRVQKSKYPKMSVNNKTVSVHKFVWEQAHGKVPKGYTIDHIDGNEYNNKLSNLRLLPKHKNKRKY
jgi:hypothetical protein